ncbi:MAG: cell division protein ZapA [Rubrivivax sp.]|jgi:cell division protein ZapA
MKQIEVSILGQVYILGCPAGGESLLNQAVAQVDREMTTIRDAGKVKARERIAVLAALNLAWQQAEGAASSVAAGPAPALAATPPLDSTGLDIAGLIRRVDSALEGDGQLL